MPRPRIDMRKIREVLRLALGEELSRRQVSAASGVPLTTVNDYLRRAASAGLKWPLPGELDDAGLEALLYPPAAPSVVSRPAPDWDRVHKELRRKGVTLQLLWVEYREACPDGYGYSQFANLYRQWRGTIDVTMRQSHKAGEKLFVDFPGETVPVFDPRTGEVALRAELFVAVMGASNYLYAEAFPSQELLYWVTAHVHCFEALGGCPQIVVCDYVPRDIIGHDEQPVAARAGGPDRLQRGQGVSGALVLADDAPQLVIAQGVAAVEVADAVGAVVGGAQPHRVLARRPAGAVAGPDGQRPELIEGKAPVGVGAGHVLDPVQLGVPVRITGLFPGPGPLEGDAAGVQDLPQPLPPDPDRRGTVS